MNNITIKIMGIGISEVFVIIFDKNNNIVFKGKTYKGVIKTCLRVNNIYKIKASFLNNKLDKTFFVSNCINNYEFAFDYSYFVPSRINSNNITFFLTDYYYDNLPIERGDIILDG